jgi:hypothetical protein
MSRCEYRKIDLNELAQMGGDIDVLNRAGAEGWELMTITINHVAYLRRMLEDATVPAVDPPPTTARGQ